MAEEKKKTEDPTSPRQNGATKGADAKEEKISKEADVVVEKKSKTSKSADEKKENRKDTGKDDKGKKENDDKSSGRKKKKIRRQIQKGRAYIKSTYNNTTIQFTDIHGNGLAWSSAGLLGFRGAKKATTYAAAQVINDAHDKVQRFGLRDVEVFIKGVGSGRDAALRALVQKGYNLSSIKDVTPIPHNGCRPKKPRRV